MEPCGANEVRVGGACECVAGYERDANADCVPIATGPGFLYVNKIVVNDDGGTAVPGNFPLSIDGMPVSLMPGAGGSSYNVTVEVSAGEPHTVTESILTGQQPYEFSGYSEDCPEGIVTVAAGETKECILTNDDVSPGTRRE